MQVSVANRAAVRIARGYQFISGSHSLSHRAKMPSCKLTYFNLTGLGEPIRFLLHHGGIEFEDFRLEYDSAEWLAIKSKMPMGALPVLEIDGKVLHQSRSIGRYLAKKLELYGCDEAQDVEIDMCVDDMEDWHQYYHHHYIEQEPGRKAKLLELANEKTLWYLAKFEQQVKKNGGFFVGGKMSWADTHFSGMLELMSNMAKKDFVKGYPALRKVDEIVRSQPKIKAYIDKRPKTEI